MRKLLFTVACTALLAAPAAAVTIDWVSVGGAGNAADTTGYGAVADVYRISETEVTNAQYVGFLNAIADSDPNGLYSTEMTTDTDNGGIIRIGSDGSYTYAARAGRQNWPVNYVSFWDGLRFANWLHNGQGAGSTETGAYTITALGITNNSITRNPGATIFLTSEDEWYKAAYYDAVSAYFDYPTGTDTQTVCAAAGATANTANCDNVVGVLTDVGSYTGSASPNGTFDQGGNVWEWNETIIGVVIGDSNRVVRGGAFTNSPFRMSAMFLDWVTPSLEDANIGFRVASLPEPSSGLLAMMGMLGLGDWRRRCA